MYDIQHIVIDNLQFMMGAMTQTNDRFVVQDLLIGEFRRFASTENIHVSQINLSPPFLRNNSSYRGQFVDFGFSIIAY